MMYDKKNSKDFIDTYWELFANDRKSADFAFSFIYNHYSPDLYSYGMSLGYPEEVCEDTLQDVFYTLYVSGGKLAKVNNKASYLFKSFKNKLIDNTRKQPNHVDIDSVAGSTGFSVKITALDTIIDEETTDRLITLVSDLLNGLTPHQKEAVYLRYMQNMSYDEIAAILDITNESVRKLVYRSLESLREKMPGFNYKDLIILLIIVSRSSGL